MIAAPKRGLRLRKYVVAALLLGVAVVSRPAAAQATSAASRPIAFDVFAGFSELKLDRGQGYNLYTPGFVVGADVTRHFSHFDLAIEPRFGHSAAKAGDDTQSYFLGDFAISKKFRRFHPYGIAGIGYGKIKYEAQNDSDNSIVYTFGPGVQYDLPFNLAVKADWQYQYWNVGTEVKGFNPNGVTIAAVYRLHFFR